MTTTAAGLANIMLDAAGMSLRYRVRANATGITAAHFHTAVAGSNGGVTLALATPTVVGSDTSYADRQAVTAAGLTALTTGRWYANVHTMTNTGGELRGQMLRPGERLYTTQLAGSNEVPPVTTTAAGSAAVIVSADGARLRYAGTFTGLTPTAGHLHVAPAGMNGPVAFGVLAAGAIDGEVETGTAMGMTATAFLSALDANGVYVNLHTTANPGGELRGQLARRPAAR